MIVGISGASGAIWGIRTLEELKKQGIETHLIISKWGEKTIETETRYQVEDVIRIASCYHEAENLGASVASGSFPHQGMVVAPCSMKTLSGIAHGFAENLVIRAAEVTLKEQRKLILLPRETPLTAIHIENMLKLSRLGVVMMPPIPAWYNRPKSLDDVIDHTVARVLDHLGIGNKLTKRWGGDSSICGSAPQ
jgi:4-hydroxy-3-polyprenylbenzoate decarboxylase